MSGDATSAEMVEGVGTVAATLIAGLRVENAQLAAERDEYKKHAEFLKAELDRLRDRMKTPREHVDLNQIQLAFDALTKELLQVTGKSAESEQTDPPSDGDDKKKKARKHTPHGRSVLPEHLPVDTLVLMPSPLPANAVKISEESSFRLGFLRAGFYRLKIVRPIYAVSTSDAPMCEGTKAVLLNRDSSTSEADSVTATIAKAAVDAGEDVPAPLGPDDRTVVCSSAPDEMIPGGLPSPDLLAHILTGKFADKLPFNRQEGIFARHGVHITRGVMCNWAASCHELAKLVVKDMGSDAIANAHVIRTDATGVLVQANEKCKKGHFWVLVADDDHVLFRYSKVHSSDEPKRFLAGFRGVVVADASNVYDQLFAQKDGPSEQGCWSHARRYFFKAIGSDKERALVGVGFCNKLFDVERALTKVPPAQRLVVRKEQSAPVVEAMRQWRDAELASDDVHDGTPIRRALNYARNHWEALTRFLQDGKIPIHNNRSELELRRLVVGRANWLFVGSDDSAEWTCTFVSLVASCQLQGISPEPYLRDLFRLLPVWPHNRFLELSPKHWRATRARIDADELALPLGPITVPPRPEKAP